MKRCIVGCQGSCCCPWQPASHIEDVERALRTHPELTPGELAKGAEEWLGETAYKSGRQTG